MSFCQFLISLLLKLSGVLTEAVQLISDVEPVRKSFAPRPNDDNDDDDCDDHDDDDDEN